MVEEQPYKSRDMVGSDSSLGAFARKYKQNAVNVVISGVIAYSSAHNLAYSSSWQLLLEPPEVCFYSMNGISLIWI